MRAPSLRSRSRVKSEASNIVDGEREEERFANDSALGGIDRVTSAMNYFTALPFIGASTISRQFDGRAKRWFAFISENRAGASSRVIALKIRLAFHFGCAAPRARSLAVSRAAKVRGNRRRRYC